jgi:hypothetical protein
MTALRLQRLHDVGFVFRQKPRYRSFEERFEELKLFNEEHGHCRVPVSRSGGLGSFVSTCRNEYTKFNAGGRSTLDEQKIQALTDLGFEYQLGKKRTNTAPPKTWEGKDWVGFKKHCLYLLCCNGSPNSLSHIRTLLK